MIGRRGIWMFAAVLALCGHAALAALALTQLDDPDDDDLGAPGIEIAVDLAAPPLPDSNRPPGPESEAAAASTAAAEQKTEIKEAALPKETPVEAQDPDRLVSVEKIDRPPIPDPEVHPSKARRAEQSAAQDATAPPVVRDAPIAAHSVTRDQGTGQSRDLVRVTWQKELLAHLDRYKRYPSWRSNQSAEITVNIVLDRTGHVVSAAVAQGSGDDAFDHAALAMIERANPVPPPPASVADEGLNFSLPVIFRKYDR